MKGIQRAKLGRIQLSSRFEDPVIERQEGDRRQPCADTPGGQLAVAPRNTPPLHDQQGAAE